MAPIKPTSRSTRRGRPPVTNGTVECSRCHRKANKLRVEWPGDRLCHSCFYSAMRIHGICPNCGHDGVLPGRCRHDDPRPVCLTCAGISGNYTCNTCGREGEIYRRGECARCTLREDLCKILLHHPADPAAMHTLIEVLCGVDRPESILTWKRNVEVLKLLGAITSGAIPLTHDGLTAAGPGRHVDHLRSLLQHHGLLPQRDEHLARFEVWLAAKLDAITSPAIRAPVEQFATWHHLRRLRSMSKPGQGTDGPRRSAQQEITETIKFLTWLHDTHHRAVAQCTQRDVDEYLASGPTTRHSIRTFFIWATGAKITTGVKIGFRQAKTTPTITQEQRLAWINEMLTGDSETLPYRIAGVLLLLYAQPLTKIAALQTTAIAQKDGETSIALGTEPVPVPEPFASQLNYYRGNRPNLRTAGGAVGTPWLFPSSRPGRHFDPQTIMKRLGSLGMNLQGARNTALQELVSEIPAPVVAEMLGYSDQVTQKHATESGNTWGRYAHTRSRRTEAVHDDPVQSPPVDNREVGRKRKTEKLTLKTDRDDELRNLEDRDQRRFRDIAAHDAAVRAIGGAQAALRAAEERLTCTVLTARQSGLTWAKIGAAAGMSTQAAHARWALRARTIGHRAEQPKLAGNRNVASASAGNQ